MKSKILFMALIIVTFFVTTPLCAQTVSLTPSSNHICIPMPGTVTFRGPGLTLEEVAQRENLGKVSDRTYKAAVIFSIAFNPNVTKGKIYNCTDNQLTFTCSFYDGSKLLTTCNVTVKPRTFNRIVPDNIDWSQLSSCNRIVCSRR